MTGFHAGILYSSVPSVHHSLFLAARLEIVGSSLSAKMDIVSVVSSLGGATSNEMHFTARASYLRWLCPSDHPIANDEDIRLL